MASVSFLSHGLTDRGLVRERNEDAFLDRPQAGPGFGLWAVADGMGGHQAGDYASAQVVAALAALKPPADLEDYVDDVKTQLLLVDRALRRRARALGPGAVIASTVVTLLAYGDDFACIWAGDSRVYLLRAGELQRLSTDHSRVQELVGAGLLKAEDAAFHPEMHVVTQAIGAGRLTFGTRTGIARPGDRFLLCSDGLTAMVGDDEIAQTLAAAAAPGDAARQLVDVVLARGAVDNVSLVVVAANQG
ncbi:MAG TPA: protein phosphatase 2C domain-containing protein [Stellaceae bacterium]|nr:protein phosphatase 2C domain-containing protein [Stellaceae bacterium]